MNKHIVFTGGGTGGHVYPALAIIDILKISGYKISWIGSKSGIEYKIVKNKGIDFYSIPSGKLRRYFSFLNFIDLFKISLGLIKAFFLLLKIKPDLLFSKGGYVTVPPIIASKILKIPSVTHESDFDPGLATKINSKFVTKVLVPYKETKDLMSKQVQKKTIITGNPVRRDFFNPSRDTGLEIMNFNRDKPIILVLGGSLGAQEINSLIQDNIEDLKKDYSIYHQMGNQNFQKRDEEDYKTVAFIDDNMADLIAASDAVISRAGAGAIWEFITVGTPSILIPLTVGSRGDQIRNANYFTDKGSSYLLKDNDVNVINLKRLLVKVIDKNNRKKMLKSCRELSENDCAMDIFDIIRGM